MIVETSELKDISSSDNFLLFIFHFSLLLRSIAVSTASNILMSLLLLRVIIIRR